MLIEEEGAVFPGGECPTTASGSDVDKTLSVLNGELSPANRKPGQKTFSSVRKQTKSQTFLNSDR
ncbi:hypothetical protein LL3_01526 [Bacillus amyloliquefaciens LL3]|nr:hypothetical protein LL3_01526 [Bacillus amyloliquefaciens LL3]